MNMKSALTCLLIMSSTSSLLSMDLSSHQEVRPTQRVRTPEPDEKRPAHNSISYAQFRASPFTTLTHVAFQVIRNASSTDYSATRTFCARCLNILKAAIDERVIW